LLWTKYMSSPGRATVSPALCASSRGWRSISGPHPKVPRARTPDRKAKARFGSGSAGTSLCNDSSVSAELFIKRTSQTPDLTCCRAVLPSQIASEHVRGHALDHRITPSERRHPFTASGVEPLPLATREVDDHPGATLDSIDGRIARVSEPDLRHVFRIIVRQESIIERDVHALLFEG